MNLSLKETIENSIKNKKSYDEIYKKIIDCLPQCISTNIQQLNIEYKQQQKYDECLRDLQFLFQEGPNEEEIARNFKIYV